jgi:hypothetical protein
MKLQRLGGWAIALVAAIGVNASAAERPSQATLAAMGLGDLVVMNDTDATAIRGMGFKGGKGKKRGGSSARAWGSSWASINGHGASAGSRNGYDAEGEHFAAGGNLSFAGKIVVSGGGGGGGGNWANDQNGNSGGHNGGGHKPRVKAVVVFAGGGSFAVAD